MKEACNEQFAKTQKIGVASQSQSYDKTNQAKQETKASEKTRKDKEQKLHQAKEDCNCEEGSIPAFGASTTPAMKKTDQNQGQN